MDLKIVVKRPSGADRALHQELRDHFSQLLSDTLELVGVIHQGNATEIAGRLREREVALATELVAGLSNPRRRPSPIDMSVCQTGDTCVPTSVANALIRIDPSQFFGLDRRERLHATHMLVDDFLAVEPGHDRGERRSLDRVQHYFAHNHQHRLGLAQDYDFELTGKILDMIFALYTEDGAVVTASKGHCVVAHGLYLSPNGDPVIELKDPLLRGSKEIGLSELASRHAWSALGGLPYAVSLGESYDAAAAKRLIADQAKRGNRGVCCSSGILRRA